MTHSRGKVRAKLSKIKEGALSRGWALARVSISASARAASHAVGSIFTDEADNPERLKKLIFSQIGLLTRELGQLKGSVMKVGQMLSMYGEHLLPPEANEVLKSLQSQSPSLEWAAIEKVLKRQFTPEQLAQLEIDHEPLAAASMGQVHAARRKSDGKQLVLKIQYPGVDRAIEGDLKALRSLLSVTNLIPKGPKYEELFREVRQMLQQEVDYGRELAQTEEFRTALRDDPRFIIPETFPEFSTKRILTSSLELGMAVDSPEALSLPQERRDAISAMALDLSLKELFKLGMMQTDPHFGNYRIRLGENGAPDRLILYDFGAVRKFPKSFVQSYRRMVRGAAHRDRKELWQGATDVGYLLPDDSSELLEGFANLCFMLTEPIVGFYDWGASDLPQRAAAAATPLAFSFRLRPPPREIIFLDRKMGGIFIFLSVLRAKIDASKILAPYLDKDSLSIDNSDR